MPLAPSPDCAPAVVVRALARFFECERRQNGLRPALRAVFSLPCVPCAIRASPACLQLASGPGRAPRGAWRDQCRRPRLRSGLPPPLPSTTLATSLISSPAFSPFSTRSFVTDTRSCTWPSLTQARRSRAAGLGAETVDLRPDGLDRRRGHLADDHLGPAHLRRRGQQLIRRAARSPAAPFFSCAAAS